MKMSVVRKQQNTKSVEAKKVHTKVRGEMRNLPIITGLEIPAPVTTLAPTRELHCDHVTVTYETVTPHKAEQMLNKNNLNRKLLQSVVDQYASDMRAGRWTYCTAPICIYDNGNIADGQHRLWAIVESGRTQKFKIERGLRQPEGLNIDMNRVRNIVDNSRISGLDTTITSNLVSISRSIEEGVATHQRSSNAEKLSIVNRHRNAATFAIKHTWGKKISNGAVLGAIGRAWYKVADKDKLMRFCEVLRTGQSNGAHESAAVSMRNYLLSSSVNLASSALWRDTFLRTQYAIHKFIDSKPLMVIRAQTTEFYPL